MRPTSCQQKYWVDQLHAASGLSLHGVNKPCDTLRANQNRMLITLYSDVTFYTPGGRLSVRCTEKSNRTLVSTLETGTKQSMGILPLERLKCSHFLKFDTCVP